jgi:hypothetical protein
MAYFETLSQNLPGGPKPQKASIRTAGFPSQESNPKSTEHKSGVPTARI